MILKIFIIGWIVLIVAIGANLLAIRFGIDTWFSFLEGIGDQGFAKTFSKLTVLSKLFLFVIYPALLGASAYFTLKLLK